MMWFHPLPRVLPLAMNFCWAAEVIKPQMWLEVCCRAWEMWEIWPLPVPDVPGHRCGSQQFFWKYIKYILLWALEIKRSDSFGTFTPNFPDQKKLNKTTLRIWLWLFCPSDATQMPLRPTLCKYLQLGCVRRSIWSGHHDLEHVESTSTCSHANHVRITCESRANHVRILQSRFWLMPFRVVSSFESSFSFEC